MDREKQKHMLLPSLIAGCLLLAYPHSGMAASAAAIFDVDSPGHSPYEQTASGRACATACALAFTAVPAGKRLVVTHASCAFKSSVSTAIPIAALGFTNNHPISDYLPITLLGTAASISIYHVSGETSMVYGPGDRPAVTIDAGVGAAVHGIAMTCTLLGYFATIQE
jgi:hypothetical protein